MKRKDLLVYCLLIFSTFNYCHSTDEEFKSSVLKKIQELENAVCLDPDGQNLNNGPILGYCELPSGLTILGEDTTVEVQKCDSLHCFKYNMNYTAPDSQIDVLIESSERCSQSIQMECLSAPYQFNGQTLLQWIDRHGNTHPMANLGASQCNLKAPTIFVDEGEIADKSLLPIKGFSYGPLRFEAESAKITIGKLKCEPSTDPMKTMVAKQQIAINSLIDRVNKLENNGKGMFFSEGAGEMSKHQTHNLKFP